MNFTGVPVVSGVFDESQKTVYVFSSVFVLGFGWLFYRILKQPLLYEEETYDKRSRFVSYLLTACLFGLFVCIALPHAMLRAELGSNPAYTVYAVAAFGILVGFNIMLSIQRCRRVRHDNENYRQPPTVTENIEPLLDKQNIVLSEHVVVTKTEDVYLSHILAMDKVNDIYGRRIVAVILFFVLSYMTIMDGFFIVFWSNKTIVDNSWVIITMGCSIRAVYGLCICGVLVHGMFHAIDVSSNRLRLLYHYGAFIILFAVVQVLSALPLLTDMTVFEVTRLIQQIPFTFFYGISCGVMLWNITYFVWVQDEKPTRASTAWYLVCVWIITIALAFIGLFI